MGRHLTANIEYTQCCRKYLNELLRRKDFSAAVRYFESMKSNFEDKSGIEWGDFISLGAQAYTGFGDPGKALGMIRSAIALLSKTLGDRSRLGESYLVLGDTLRELGELDEAERAFRDAESIFRRDDNISGAGDALNRLAGLFYRKSNYKSALKSLLSAIEFARQENNNKKLAYLFGNIGRIYILLGRLNKAEEYVRFNIDLSNKLDDKVEVARATLSLAYINMQRCQYFEAERYLKDALQNIEDQNLIKEKTIYLTYLGELALKRKKYDLSENSLLEAVENGNKVGKESNLAARPQRWLAELYLAQGNYRKALSVAGGALIIMKKLGNTGEIGALLKIKAACLENLEQKAKAEESYTESIRLLEKDQIRIELASALTLAGGSGLFDTNRRIMFLCRAEDIYVEFGAANMTDSLRRSINAIDITQDRPTEVTTSAPDMEEPLPDFPTKNKKLQKIIMQLKLVRNADLPILITGETGVGKDYLAKYFHSIARPEGPYVAINCAAIPESLIESELFGYRKGAFTGADDNRNGLFLTANGGVLLLDEIGELPPMLQAKLLSVIETKKLRPLGSSKEIDLDIIILAATNRDLSEMVEQGTFRQDLYYRLAGMTLNLPPLRERKEDIPFLLESFLRKVGLLGDNEKPEDELIVQFAGFDWPGNIRQMENKVSQLKALVSMTQEGSLTELARGFFETKNEESAQTLFERVELFEKKLLIEALAISDGNKSQAARLLSIHESTFRAKMKRYSLHESIN